jgi:hypothetical protein
MDREVNVRSLQEVYENYKDKEGWGDKGTLHSYIEPYETHMDRKSNIDILEIGVQKGHSIAMWNDYFENSNVYGIDISFNNLIFKDLKNIFICDATDESLINETFKDIEFDYVVDDGSHLIEHQIKSFDILWPRIKPGGKYFIEDVNGDEAIEAITNHLITLGLSYTLIDHRHIKGRYDDIIIFVEKNV